VGGLSGRSLGVDKVSSLVNVSLSLVIVGSSQSDTDIYGYSKSVVSSAVEVVA